MEEWDNKNMRIGNRHMNEKIWQDREWHTILELNCIAEYIVVTWIIVIK